MGDTNIKREILVAVAVPLTQGDFAVVADVVVHADFPHAHAHQARGQEGVVLYVPHSPFHEAHGRGGQDPAHRGHRKAGHLAVGARDEQQHGHCAPRGAADRQGVREGERPPRAGMRPCGPGTRPRVGTRDVHALPAGHRAGRLREGPVALVIGSPTRHRLSNRHFHFWAFVPK